MTREDKILLLEDLCARLPFGVKVHDSRLGSDWTLQQMHIHMSSIDKVTINFDYESEIDNFRPYLRPLSSMTEEEYEKLGSWIYIKTGQSGQLLFDGFKEISTEDTLEALRFLNQHLFDYRGLIERGLALESTEEMYKTIEI